MLCHRELADVSEHALVEEEAVVVEAAKDPEDLADIVAGVKLLVLDKKSGAVPAQGFERAFQDA